LVFKGLASTYVNELASFFLYLSLFWDQVTGFFSLLILADHLTLRN